MKYYFCNAALKESAVAFFRYNDDGTLDAKYAADSEWFDTITYIKKTMLRKRGFKKITEDEYIDLCFVDSI
jgi:hypothetical protein